MKRQYYYVLQALFGVLTFGITVASEFESYNPDTYPDSLRDWTLCRVPEPSLICDPNQLLNPAADGTDGVLKLHRALRQLRYNTNCSCGDPNTYISGSDPPRLGSTVGVCEDGGDPHGYTISIAVLKKILVEERAAKTVEELVSVFANALRNRYNRGQCQDDAYIVFSVDDNAVWTSTGSNTAKKLSPQFITSVSKNSQEYFARDDPTGALLYMVHQYGLQLGQFPELGGEVGLEEEKCWWERNLWSRLPNSWSRSPWRWWILALVVLVLVLLVVGLVYGGYRLLSLVYGRARHHQDGYSMGRAQEVGKR